MAFTGCGAGLFAALFGRRRAALAVGLFVLFLSGTTLLEYLTGANFGIDEFVIKDFHQPDTLYPGRMAPNTAMAFACAALFLVWAFDDR